ncbi:MAG: AlpA family phage regulatory protein [Betaproteobacteria bacterium]|nr:AlpA family phage regulatory protein [Betaproteobacteria bacterium]
MGPQAGAQPPQRGLIPIGRTTFYQLIKSGRIPKPTKIGRVSVWRLSEVRAGIDAGRDHA